jgi:hypothetical protein
MTSQQEKIDAWKAEQRRKKKESRDLFYESTPGDPAAAWGKLELAIPDFGPLERIAKIIDELRKVLTAVVNLLEVIANLIIGLKDAAAALIKEIIDQIKAFIEGLFEDAGIYAIFIPNGKRFNTTFAGFGDITPPASKLFAPAPTDLVMSDDTRKFLVNVNRYNGGNAGFYRQVAASLQDKGDRNRPQFMSEADWVGGLVMMIGTNIDPFGFLDDLWRLKGTFGQLFKATGETKVPKPENLQAYALVKPTSLAKPANGKKLSVLLKWDTLDVPFVTLPDMGGIIVVPKRRAIFAIRNNIQASTANNVIELVGTRNITASTKHGNDIWVVNEGEYKLGENSLIIRDLPIDDGDIYHFAMAWQLTAYDGVNSIIAEAGGWSASTGKNLGYWDLSNMPQLYPFPTSPDSTPPDWVRTPSVAELIPPIAYFIRNVAGYLEAIAARLEVPGNLLKDYVAFLKAEMLRYEAIVTDILLQIRSITELLRLPEKLGGVYLRAFQGSGGNQYFLSDLANSLSEGFPNAPPFHRGDEYVMGVVLMTGGPKARVVASTALLEAIFVGGTGEVEVLADTLGDAIGGLEEATFGENLNEGEEETATFNDALEPLKLCTVPIPLKTQFGDDLQPMEILP